MKHFVFILLIISVTYVCMGQTPDSSSHGELVFKYPSVNPPNPFSASFGIEVHLVDPVFNDSGKYTGEATGCYSLGTSLGDNYYRSGLHLYGGSANIYALDQIVCWESAASSDQAADSSLCAGMLGWGLYKVTIQASWLSNEQSLEFYVNLVDGNWMSHSDFRDLVAVNLEIANDSLTALCYKWKTSTWFSIQNGSIISYSDLVDDGGRERTIIRTIDKEFRTVYGGTYPLATNDAIISRKSNSG